MDKKIELEILGISNAPEQPGAFALTLGEVGGERRISIIIGPGEAQSIFTWIKGCSPSRPLTHDLFLITLGALGANVIRALIYKEEKQIYYSYIYVKQGQDILRIDSRTSDAIALAARAGAPILIYESILTPEHSAQTKEKEAKDALEQAIREENYELAAQIRDRMNNENKKQ